MVVGIIISTRTRGPAAGAVLTSVTAMTAMITAIFIGIIPFLGMVPIIIMTPTLLLV